MATPQSARPCATAAATALCDRASTANPGGRARTQDLLHDVLYQIGDARIDGGLTLRLRLENRCATLIADGGSFGDVCVGSFRDLPLTINNNGDCNLLISNITSSSGQFLIASAMAFPVVIGPGGNLQVPIGPHDVVFRHPDLGEQHHAVSVTLTAPARLSVDLRKK